jgi:F-type H+-transporting ATPase subunit delta
VSSDVSGVTGLSGRYATALFELADEQKQLDQTAEDLTSIGAMLEESEDLVRLIRSPVISKGDQQRAMQAVMEEAGIGGLTRNFIGVVIDNRRLFSLPGMIKGYLALLANARGEATAEVISAKPLSDAQQQAIMDSLRKSVGTKIAIDAKVDETLLGGLIVKVGSRMVDTSLKTKLAGLRLAMKGVG